MMLAAEGHRLYTRCLGRRTHELCRSARRLPPAPMLHETGVSVPRWSVALKVNYEFRSYASSTDDGADTFHQPAAMSRASPRAADEAESAFGVVLMVKDTGADRGHHNDLARR